MSTVALTKWPSQASGSRPPLIYQPLDPGNHEIRLVTSLRVDARGDLECELMTVPIHDCPPFTALSYVWGDDADRVPIRVNGQVFQATKSLASALRYLPRHWKSKFPGRSEEELLIWADAVCIDQSDNSERGHQVQLMKGIFSGAELVMCWMPNATQNWLDGIFGIFDDDQKDEYLRTGFETLELISEQLHLVEEEVGKMILEMDLNDERLVRWLEGCPELRDCATTSEWPCWSNKNWVAVDYFFQLQYWSRLWIFQEVALARDPLLFCKSNSLSFSDTFNRVLVWFDFLGRDRIPAPGFIPSGLWHSFTTGDGLRYHLASGHWRSWISQRTKSDSTSSWFTMFNAFDLTATEPKDYVYGILGVMEIDMEVDYSERTSAAKALHGMLAAWLKTYQAANVAEPRNPELHFLPWAGLGRECERPECRGFASWAPNPHHFKHSISQSMFFGKVNSDFGVFSDATSRTAYIQDSSLFVSGVVIDSVQELYGDILRFDDLGPFLSWLLSRPQNDAGDPAATRSLLRALFEVICGEDIPFSIWNNRLHSAGPSSHDFIVYAYTFVLGIVNGGHQYVAMLERLGLRTDSEDGFMQSLYETFLDSKDDGSGRPEDEATSFWLQDLLTFETTREMPRDIRVAHCCKQMGIIPFRARMGRLGSGVIFRTSRGYFGFGSRLVAVGDLACVLKGYKSVALLRENENHFLYVGEGKVHGAVYGGAAELVKGGISQISEFELK